MELVDDKLRLAGDRPRRPAWSLGRNGIHLALVLPGALCGLIFICLPLGFLLYQSILSHNPGEIGAAADSGLTAKNYGIVLSRTYLPYFWDTLRISAVSASAAVAVSALIAFRIARTASSFKRKALITFMLGLIFLSVLVRVYAISLTFGIGGPLASFLRLLGFNVNSRSYAEFMVVLGFLHFLIPVTTLILVSTFQQIPASLYEAACSLGAPRWKAHWDTTLRQAAAGLYSALIVAFSMAASSFVIPLILGQGKVQFLANLSYIRFGEIADYPGGAAFAIVLLAVSLVIVGVLGQAVKRIAGERR